MNFLLTTIFFLLGLIIGSFLNVVIFRLNTNKSLGGRSACMVCQSKLKWYELIPVFSFLGLRGRCKSCKTKISFQYPLVEIVTGLVFAILSFKFQYLFFISIPWLLAALVFYGVVFSVLIIVATYDLKHGIIPDILSIILGIVTFFGLFVFNTDSSLILPYFHLPTFTQILAGPLVAFPFALLWLISKGAWMGLGDAKLAVGLGWLAGLSTSLSGIILAFWIGALVGISLLVFSKKYKIKSELPFAPYLVLGSFIAFILELHIFY